MLLTSEGMWTSIVIAICACCVAVVFSRARRKEMEARPFIRDLERGRRLRSASGSRPELQIAYRRGSPSFRWDQIGIEELHASEGKQ